MNLNQLFYIYHVVKYKTLREASNQLFITQPAISQQIKNLENEIGFPIFQKQGRNVILTPEGELLYPKIENIVKSYQNIELQIKEIQNPDHGQLRLGIGPMLENRLLPEVFKQFNRKYPTITISNHQGGSVELKKLLLNNQLDIIIASVDDSSTESLKEHNINQIKLMQFKFIAVVSDDHHLSRFQDISIYDLENEQLILYHNSLIKGVILSLFGNDFENRIIFSSSNNETNRQLIKLGTTVSLLPEPYVNMWTEKECEKLHFIKLNDFELKLNVACLYKQSHHFPPYKQSLINLIEKTIKSFT